MPQRTSAQYRMADRLAGGELAAELLRLAAEGHSLRLICSMLYAEHGIEVSAATVQSWTAQAAAASEPVAS